LVESTCVMMVKVPYDSLICNGNRDMDFLEVLHLRLVNDLGR